MVWNPLRHWQDCIRASELAEEKTGATDSRSGGEWGEREEEGGTTPASF